MGNVIKFPKKMRKQEQTGYRINLYTEEDILVVLTCLNLTDDLDDDKTVSYTHLTLPTKA